MACWSTWAACADGAQPVTGMPLAHSARAAAARAVVLPEPAEPTMQAIRSSGAAACSAAWQLLVREGVRPEGQDAGEVLRRGAIVGQPPAGLGGPEHPRLAVQDLVGGVPRRPAGASRADARDDRQGGRPRGPVPDGRGRRPVGGRVGDGGDQLGMREGLRGRGEPARRRAARDRAPASPTRPVGDRRPNSRSRRASSSPSAAARCCHASRRSSHANARRGGRAATGRPRVPRAAVLTPCAVGMRADGGRAPAGGARWRARCTRASSRPPAGLRCQATP